MPWNNGYDVYYHGIKQDLSDEDDEEADPILTILQGLAKLLEAGGFSPRKSLHLFKSQLARQLSKLLVKSQ